MRALEREVGVIVYNRPQMSGEYSYDQVSLAEGIARYLAVALDNVRLMDELNTRRRDLELVRDSSLDFAQSLDMTEVLEAVVARLLDALAMHACDVYEVDHDSAVLRLLVSYDQDLDAGEAAGRETALDHYASSALAVESRQPVLVTSLDDQRLSQTERRLLERLGHRTQLSIPLHIRDRVIGLVKLYDDQEDRRLNDEEIELAGTICRFAALAIDKARLFDEQRTITERRDGLARRLQRLQSFSVDLNRKLDLAELQDVLDEVVGAALDLLHVRVAGVLSGSGEYLAVKALAVEGGPSLAAAEADLLQRCREALALPGDDVMAGGELVAASVVQGDGLLFAMLEGETPQQASTLVVADKQGGSFDDEDRLLLVTLAAQLSASLHNATAYQREHVIAETFQTALLHGPAGDPGYRRRSALPGRDRHGARGRRFLRPGDASAPADSWSSSGTCVARA